MNEEMKELKIMKTTKNIKVKGYRLAVMVILAVLPMIVNAVEYQSTYRGAHAQPVYGVAPTTTAPSVAFQTTSTLSFSNNLSSSYGITLNMDGSVNERHYISRPRRIDANGNGIDDSEEEEDDEGGNAGTPGQTVDPHDQLGSPLGDAVIPLLLMLVAYAGVRIMRSRHGRRTQDI